MNTQQLGLIIQTRLPTLIWGGSGVGKSSYIRELGERLNVPVEVVIGSKYQAGDFGFPVLTGRTVHVALHRWGRSLIEAGEGILFLDELTGVRPSVQSAMLSVVLDRVIGEEALPEKVLIVAAANPPEVAAGGWDLSPPMANRFVHFYWKVEPESWANKFQADNWYSADLLPLLPTWRALIPAAQQLVAGFIRRNPLQLYDIPDDDRKSGQAWPSPRTWDYASQVWAACESARIPISRRFESTAGCVGEGAALAFITWVESLDLPDPIEALRHPGKVILPDRGDRRYIFMTAIASTVVQNMTREYWDAGWTIIDAAARHGAADVAVIAAKMLVMARRDRSHDIGSSLIIPDTAREALTPILRAVGVLPDED